MSEDLLMRIQRETHERLKELRGAVEEHARLQNDLRALQDVPERPAAPEPVLASESPGAPEPSASLTRSRPVCPLARTRMVSPKVARLMHTPRRPALERRGVIRVGAARLDCLPDDPADEIDTQAGRCQ